MSQFDTSEFDGESEEGLEPELDLEEPQNSVIDRLVALKREIDEILSDMGYDEGFDSEEFDSFADEDESTQRDGESEFDIGGLDDGSTDDEFGEDEFGGETDELEGEEFGDDEFADEEVPEDEDFQGDIRTVKGADLVYKRKQEDGNYEELWIYNVGSDIRSETQIRKAILAGTDIVPSHRESEDGSQHANTYTLGNVQYLQITGLPN